jgi:excisionase family DNA binding protein
MDHLMTIRQVAEILGFSVGTVYKYCRDGRLRAINLREDGARRVIRISEKDLNSFIIKREAIRNEGE